MDDIQNYSLEVVEVVVLVVVPEYRIIGSTSDSLV